jgi:dipeptidase E
MPLLLASTFQYFDVAKHFSQSLKVSKIACITTAALMQIDDNPVRPEWVNGEISAVKNLSYEFFEYDLRGKSYNDLQSDLLDCDLIYFIGGNTFCLLDAANKSGFGQFASEYLKAGKSIWGGSAGAIIFCPDINFIRAMDDPDKSNLRDTKGLELTDLYILLHWKGKHQKEAEQCIANNPDLNILCLTDEQAVYIQDNQIEVLS